MCVYIGGGGGESLSAFTRSCHSYASSSPVLVRSAAENETLTFCARIHGREDLCHAACGRNERPQPSTSSPRLKQEVDCLSSKVSSDYYF